MVSPKAGIPNPVRVVGNAGIPPEPLYHIIARLGHSFLYNLVYAWILAPCTITLSHLKPGFNSPRKGIPLKGRPRTTITRTSYFYWGSADTEFPLPRYTLWEYILGEYIAAKLP
jgi:hypothetical protein